MNTTEVTKVNYKSQSEMSDLEKYANKYEQLSIPHAQKQEKINI